METPALDEIGRRVWRGPGAAGMRDAHHFFCTPAAPSATSVMARERFSVSVGAGVEAALEARLLKRQVTNIEADGRERPPKCDRLTGE